MSSTGNTPAPAAFTLDYEMVLASMLGGVVVLSAEQKLVFANAAAEALLERSSRDLLERSGSEVFADSPWLVDLLARMAASKKLSLRDEGKLGADTNATDVLAVASALHDRDGTCQGVVLALHNLGRRQWLRSDEALHSRLAEIDGLVSSVAHEINNPLSGIRGAAQLLSKKLSDRPDLSEYSEMIVRQADRMGELIRGLLALEAAVPAMEKVNIHRIITEVLLLEQTDLEARQIQVETHFDPSLPEVLGNADQLQQLFLNLIKNALAVCPTQSGNITIATRMETSFYVETRARRVRYISVDVSDNGPGLDAETAKNMFLPFFSGSPNGHGMGLTIARNIATAHNGQIRAENLGGGGARLRVTLPVAETADKVSDD